MFYPDFILKTNDGRIGIFDTKGGITAENSREKAEALHKYLKKLNENICVGNSHGCSLRRTKDKFWGGILVKKSGKWMLNQQEQYSFNERNLKGWEEFEFLSNI